MNLNTVYFSRISDIDAPPTEPHPPVHESPLALYAHKNFLSWFNDTRRQWRPRNLNSRHYAAISTPNILIKTDRSIGRGLRCSGEGISKDNVDDRSVPDVIDYRYV